MLTISVAQAQDTAKIREIDAVVAGINNSGLPVQRDTLVQGSPESGLEMTTYLTMVKDGSALIKFVNLVHTTLHTEPGRRQMSMSSTFYYNHNHLIKVEEYAIENGVKKAFDWYYAADKLLYTTMHSDESEARAAQLLTISKEMQKQAGR